MTRDEWDRRAFQIDVIKTLAAAYREEHDWDNDEDAEATSEMLRDAETMYAALMAQLGEPPASEPVVYDPAIPF